MERNSFVKGDVKKDVPRGKNGQSSPSAPLPSPFPPSLACGTIQHEPGERCKLLRPPALHVIEIIMINLILKFYYHSNRLHWLRRERERQRAGNSAALQNVPDASGPGAELWQFVVINDFTVGVKAETARLDR